MLMTTTTSRPLSGQSRATTQPSQQAGNMGSLFGGTGINWGAISVPGQRYVVLISWLISLNHSALN